MKSISRSTFVAAGSLACGLIAAGCGSSDKVVSGPQPIEIQFAARVGSEPFACGRTYEGLGTTASQGSPMDGRFYVSDIHFVNPDESERFVTLEQDGEWQLDDVALLDFEDGSAECAAEGTPETNTSIRGTVEPGTAAKIHFTVGVPFALNHGDATTAEPPLDQTPMFWNWNFGYKFIKIELSTDGQPDGFFLHLGSTGCEGDGAGNVSSCSEPNRVDAEIPLANGFDASRNVVVLDIGKLFSDADVDVNTPETAPGCMSFPGDPECPAIFAHLGLPFGEQAGGTQDVFSVE